SRAFASWRCAIFLENRALPWHSNCTPQPMPPGGNVPPVATGAHSVRDMLDRILASYEEIDRRFAAAGGVGSLLNLYEQVRRGLERVSFADRDVMTLEIRWVIEALLKTAYELRKVDNLKPAFEARQR